MKLAWALLLVGCTGESMSQRESPIIGPSHAAALGELPATGALLSNALGFWSLHCTGTLIAPNAVLTAAHCVQFDEVPSFTFERYAYKPAETAILSASGKIAHPDWNGAQPLGQLGQANDLGILFLAQPVTGVEPARIVRPGDAARIAIGLEVTLAGYGIGEDYDDAGVPGYSYKRVGTSHLTDVGDHEVAIQGAGDAGACNGDSGGPAYAMLGGMPRVAATVSRGLASMDCTKGGVFTRVDPYIAWIESLVTLPCGSGNSPACAQMPDAGAGDDPGSDSPPADPATTGCGCQSGGSSNAWLLLALMCVGRALLRRRPSGAAR